MHGNLCNNWPKPTDLNHLLTKLNITKTLPLIYRILSWQILDVRLIWVDLTLKKKEKDAGTKLIINDFIPSKIRKNFLI